MSLSFGQSARLKSSKKIEYLFEGGKSIRVAELRLVYSWCEGKTQVGFVVPKKSQALAVNRNRIKRLLREAYASASGFDFLETGYTLMFIYSGKKLPEFEEVKGLLIKVLSKISTDE